LRQTFEIGSDFARHHLLVDLELPFPDARLDRREGCIPLDLSVIAEGIENRATADLLVR
jgi:hypothetical protein